MRTERVLLLGFCVAVLACTGLAPRNQSTVRIVDSDTMLILNRRLATGFMESQPRTSVVFAGGGTGKGVEALLDGGTDICAASRPLSPSETEDLHDRFRTLGVRFLVAQGALSIYLHPDNPVRDLSLSSLRELFSGSVTDWSAVADAPGRVVPILRPPSSGTHRFFRDHVLKGGACPAGARTVVRTGDVIAAVVAEPGAIGFAGLAYTSPEISCSVNGFAETPENVLAGTYPLARFLMYYTAEPPRGMTREFIDGCLGRNGQALVADVGYIPLWPRP